MNQAPDSSSSSSTSASGNTNLGLLLQAVDWAVSTIPGATLGNIKELSCYVGTQSSSDLAVLMSRKLNVSAHADTLSAGELLQAISVGFSVVASVEGRYLAASARGLVLIGPAGESPIRPREKALRRKLRTDRFDAVVLEPIAALESLSRRQANVNSHWSRLRALMSLESRDLWAVVIYSVALGALSLAVPVAVQVLVNTIAFGSLVQPLVVLALMLFGVLVFSGLLQVIEWYAVELLQRRIFVRVAEDFAGRLARVPLEVHDRIDARELSNRFFEIVGLQKGASRLLLDGLGLALQTAVGLLLLAFYHPILLAFNAGLVMAIGTVVLVGRHGVKTAFEESKAKYKVAAWLESIAANPSVFKSNRAWLFATGRSDALIRTYLHARRRHYSNVLRQLVGGLGIQVTAMVALLGIGGWLVLERELTLGQLVAAELVVGAISTGLTKLGKFLEDFYDLLASVDKIGKVVDLPMESLQPIHYSRSEAAAVDLNDVVVSKGDRVVTCIAHERVDAGERVLLAGPSGSGKTAVLEAIAGHRAPTSGQVFISKSGERAVSAQNARDELFLLRARDIVDGTVLDNLRLGDVLLEEESAWLVLERVFLGDVVSALPSGIHTEMIAKGPPLSSTQIARLCLARALLAKPSVLVIDGALDKLGLPAQESAEVLRATLGSEAPWTVVIASKDPQVETWCGRRWSLPTASGDVEGNP